MKGLRILGPRILVKVYEMPSQTASGIIIPDSYRKMFDGHTFEVVSVGEKVREVLGVVAEMDDKIVPGLRADMDLPPLDLQPDDIIQTRGQYGTYSPDLTAYYGFNVYFMDVIQNVQGREKSTIEWVWPSKNWKEEAA